MDTTKLCSSCNSTFSLDCFYIQGQNKNGTTRYHSFCKQCVLEYNKRMYRENESYRERRRNRSKNLTDDQVASRKKTSAAYYESVKGRASTLVNGAKRRSLEKGIDCDLDFDFVHEKLLHGKCEVTGIEFDFKKPTSSVKNAYSPSIDRIDSSLGYTKQNCRIVIWQFNMMKGELSDVELINLCNIVSERLKNGLDL